MSRKYGMLYKSVGSQVTIPLICTEVFVSFFFFCCPILEIKCVWDTVRQEGK